VIYLEGTAKKVIDRFVEETKKGIKITERERIVTQINAFDLITGEYRQIDEHPRLHRRMPFSHRRQRRAGLQSPVSPGD